MSEKKLFLIDATAFCYRAFYAIRGLATSFGEPTNAVYGFLNMFLKLLKQYKPEYLAVCFDVSRDTFRQKKFAEYKTNRPAMPDGLSSQMPVIKKIIRAYGIQIFEKEGFEADDLIAALSEKAKKSGIEAVVVTNDKDLMQLVNENTTVLSPGKDEDILYDAEKVRQRFGIDPQQIPDLVALAGDSVDNIPGVKGVSDKRAAQLVSEFGSIESLLKKIDKVTPDKLRQSIEASAEQIKLSKELAVLVRDMELEFRLQDLKIKEPDYNQLFDIYKHLEFKALLKTIPQKHDELDSIEVKELDEKSSNDILASMDEVCLYSPDGDDIVFFANNVFFRLLSWELVKKVLQDAGIKKTGHDLKKLKVALAKKGICLDGFFFDTMIAAYLLNPSKADYGLNELVWEYLKKSVSLDSMDSASGVSFISRLKSILEKELKEKKLIQLFSEIEMPLACVLAQMEYVGIGIDSKFLKELSKDTQKRLQKLIEQIYSYTESQFNINSPKQLREVLFEILKLPVVKRTKTGPSTDEEVLKALSQKHSLPALLLEYRQLTKLKSTYIDGMLELIDEKAQRIHTCFNQTATETGRLSSSSPNLQNLPVKTELGKKIREAVVAFSPQSDLVSFDYSQIELRILAHLACDKVLIEAFESARDIHKKTASLIYHVDEEDVTEEMRNTSKRVNFGIIYGLSAYGLSRDLEISQDQAQVFIDAYFATYKDVKNYIDSQIKSAEEDGFVITILGRRRYLPEIKNKNMAIRQLAQRQAVNTPIQGSASDMIKMAMVNIDRQFSKKGLKSRMVLQIHDELLFDVERTEQSCVVGIVRDAMEGVLRLKVPVKVDIKIGRNWSVMKEYGEGSNKGSDFSHN